MTDNQIIILETFGLQAVKPLFFTPGIPLPTGFSDNNIQINTVDTDVPQYKTVFGQPMWQYFRILAGSYSIPGFTDVITYPEFTVDTVLVEINQSKNIVKTDIQGRQGTVKEYISLGDFEISIKGAIASTFPSQAYPQDQMDIFNAIMAAPVAIQVSSPLINQFCEYIVIDKFSLKENEGGRNLQFFEMTAISDFPIILEANA